MVGWVGSRRPDPWSVGCWPAWRGAGRATGSSAPPRFAIKGSAGSARCPSLGIKFYSFKKGVKEGVNIIKCLRGTVYFRFREAF